MIAMRAIVGLVAGSAFLVAAAASEASADSPDVEDAPKSQKLNARKRCRNLVERAPPEMEPHLRVICSGNITRLRQRAFDNGTYFITEPGIYVLNHDIVFAPNTPKMFPPKDSEAYPSRKGFFLGFFAAIVIAADNVVLDLNGFTLKTSFEFVMRQRFFSLVELANLPFIPGAGPPQFATLVDPIRPANNLIITDGNLGLSSHMAVHGNSNRNVWVNEVRMFDYETGGFQVNNGSNVHLTHLRVGPSLGAPGSSHDVPALGTLSQSVNLLRHVQGTAWETQEEFADLDAAVETFISQRLQGQEPNPAAPFADPLWGYTGLPDGSAIYGISVTPAGPSIGQFGTCMAGLENDVVSLTNVEISGLYLDTQEVIQLKDSRGRPVVGPAGDVFQVFRVQGDDGTYQGNVLSDAQAALGQLALDHAEMAATNFSEYFFLFGGSNVPPPVQEWVRGGLGFEEMVRQLGGSLVCGMDSMSHINKGVVATRLECISSLGLDTVQVSDVVQQGVRAPDWLQCTNAHDNYFGNDATGIRVSGLPTWYHNEKPKLSKVSGVQSRGGRAIGLAAMIGDTAIRGGHLEGIEFRDIQSGEAMMSSYYVVGNGLAAREPAGRSLAVNRSYAVGPPARGLANEPSAHCHDFYSWSCGTKGHGQCRYI